MYYEKIASYLDINDIIDNFSKGDVIFTQVEYDINQRFKYVTPKGKNIPFNTIVFAGDNVVVFDEKLLGLRKDNKGSKRVYRIKCKELFNVIYNYNV